MTKLLKVVVPLAIGLAGIGIALLWFENMPLLAFVPSIAAGLIGWATLRFTRYLLEHDMPVRATRWIFGSLLLPFSLAMLASATAIVIAVAVEPPGENPSTQDKEIAAAVVATFGGFLIVSFIEWGKEADTSWLGNRFKKRFQKTYGERFPRREGGTAPRGELAVKAEAEYGFQGWDHAARIKRAKIVKEELRKL